MNDYKKLATTLSNEYIGCIFDCYDIPKDCGFSKKTKYYIRIIELEDDFNIRYGYHFDEELNFLGYGYIPQSIRINNIFPVIAKKPSKHDDETVVKKQQYSYNLT